MILESRQLAGRTGHEAGRALLAELYRREVGQPLPPIAYGPFGKPYFTEGPWHFSVSHTRRRVFCALSLAPVGLDAEELDRQVDLRLAGRILSPGERARFDAAPDPRRALLTFWVLKEARAKLTGLGLQGNLRDTDFSLSDPRVRELDGCLVAVLED